MAPKRRRKTKRPQQPKPNNKRSTEFCYYVVAWIDLMSQKEALKKLRDLPETPETELELIAALRETFGAVRQFRETFRPYFKAAAAPIPLPAHLSKDQRAQVRALRRDEVRTRGVSDAMVIDVPLAREQPVPLNGILSMFYSFRV